jgi:hypothetical protein
MNESPVAILLQKLAQMHSCTAKCVTTIACSKLFQGTSTPRAPATIRLCQSYSVKTVRRRSEHSGHVVMFQSAGGSCCTPYHRGGAQTLMRASSCHEVRSTAGHATGSSNRPSRWQGFAGKPCGEAIVWNYCDFDIPNLLSSEDPQGFWLFGPCTALDPAYLLLVVAHLTAEQLLGSETHRRRGAKISHRDGIFDGSFRVE